jgi:hypothetical protein
MIMDEEVKLGFIESLGPDYKYLSGNELDALLESTLSEMTESQAENFWNTLKNLGKKILASLPNIVQGVAAGTAVGGVPGGIVGGILGGLSGTQQQQPTGGTAPTTPSAAPTTPTTPSTAPTTPTTPSAAPTTPTTPSAAPAASANSDFSAEAYEVRVRDHRGQSRPPESRDHRRQSQSTSAPPPPPVAPPVGPSSQPPDRPGFIWVNDHWERARASGEPSYPSQPPYPYPSQPPYPYPSQPPYPYPSQPPYPYPSQPPYPYPSQPPYSYDYGQPQPYPYDYGQPQPYPYDYGQPQPYPYDYGQPPPYPLPGEIPYTETNTASTPTTGSSNARAAALDILEIIKNPKFLQVLTATILGPKGKNEIEIAGKSLSLGTLFNLLKNLSSAASTGTASKASSTLETYIESKPGIDSGNVYDVDDAIMDLIREDNLSVSESISPNSNNMDSSYPLPEDDVTIELD